MDRGTWPRERQIMMTDPKPERSEGSDAEPSMGDRSLRPNCACGGLRHWAFPLCAWCAARSRPKSPEVVKIYPTESRSAREKEGVE